MAKGKGKKKKGGRKSSSSGFGYSGIFEFGRKQPPGKAKSIEGRGLGLP